MQKANLVGKVYEQLAAITDYYPLEIYELFESL